MGLEPIRDASYIQLQILPWCSPVKEKATLSALLLSVSLTVLGGYGTFCRGTNKSDEPSSMTTSEGTVTPGHVLFSKYFVREPQGNIGHALFRRRKLSTWQSVIFWVGLSQPSEGKFWVRLKVCEVLQTTYKVDSGAVASRPVNLMDRNAQIAMYVNPFTKLYQVRMFVTSTFHMYWQWLA